MSFVADQVRSIDLQLDRLHLERVSAVLPIVQASAAAAASGAAATTTTTATATGIGAGPTSHSEPAAAAREIAIAAAGPPSLRIARLRAIIQSLSSTSSAILTPQQILSLLAAADVSITPITDADADAITTLQEQEAYLEHELSWLVVSKAAIQTYGVILRSLVDETLPLSDDIYYWDEVLASYRYTLLYSLQTSPWRLARLAAEVYHDARARFERNGVHVEGAGEEGSPPPAAPSISQSIRRFYSLIRSSFRERSLSALNTRLVSPFALITHTIHQKHANISKLRALQASALGVLMNEGLTFENEEDREDWKGVVERSIVLMENVVKNVCDIDQVGGVEQFEDLVFTGSSDGVGEFDDVAFEDGVSGGATGTTGASAASGASGTRRGSALGVSTSSLLEGKKEAVIPYVLSLKLQEVLQKHLPTQEFLSKEIMRENGRPSAVVRYWIPVTALFLSSTTLLRVLVNRREAIQTWVRELGETLVDFWANWVVEPIKRIISTIRTGEDVEAALMTRESLISDRQSLERMVVDFVIDNPATTDSSTTEAVATAAAKLTPEQIALVRENVKQGDLTPVLRVYEQDLKKPIRGAVTGELLRSLLIQIQKTKVDVEVAVSGIDNMLKSQQLLFGMLGLTPGVLIVVGTTRWVRGAWGGRRGMKRSEARARMVRILRHIDRILSTSAAFRATNGNGARGGSTLTFKEHGLLLCEIHVLRELAGYVLPRGVVMKEFLEDLEELGSIRNGVLAQRGVVERVRWAYAQWMH
ncbi:Nuclear control of ATPase protein 2 [Orbilia brochopaga]|uniref:Nuclear control of ATPase protein 2 n=1 Tax=Orbilia brochopaga TaxID=3140254 RepID=A0AAV9UHY0_9PEZI